MQLSIIGLCHFVCFSMFSLFEPFVWYFPFPNQKYCLFCLLGLIHDTSPSWKDVEVFGEEEVLDLKLLALASRAPSTISNYRRLVSRWSSFARSKGLSDVPASISGLALYFNFLRKSTSSKSILESSKAAIAWVHKVSGYSNPFSNEWLSNIIEGAIRLTAGPSVSKKPVSPDIIRSICADTDFTNVKQLRATCLCVLLYSGFFRINELLSLKASDFTFFESYLSINISRSKTDQYNKGNNVIISSSGLNSCPVSITRKHFYLSCNDASSDLFLFRP